MIQKSLVRIVITTLINVVLAAVALGVIIGIATGKWDLGLWIAVYLFAGALPMALIMLLFRAGIGKSKTKS